MRYLIAVWVATVWAAPYGVGGELRIEPATVSFTNLRSTQPLLVTWVENGQVIGERTAEVKWSGNSKVATVDGKGVVRPLANGEATLTASWGKNSATVKVNVQLQPSHEIPNFRNEIIPILTRTGCNSGACHGALAGKGGFKLSLRGYDPETDHFVMTRQALARRVNDQEPEKSLLLRKATREIPHGGGTRFDEDSKEYRTLLNWIRSGSQSTSAQDANLDRIELFPKSALLKPNDKLQILVRAWYSDGTSKDVTTWSRFGSTEDLVAGVSENGLVTVGGNGEAAITVGFGTQVATMTITSPFSNSIAPEIFARSPKHNFVDEPILRKLQLLRIPPAEPCTDAEFIRRWFLDAAGILPTPEEVAAFVQDTAKDKRNKLIDSLLERPEFTDYWTYKWSDLMLVSTRRLPQPAMWAFYRSVRKAVADNKPWDQFARDILTATGSTHQQGEGNFFVLHKDVAELNESVSVTFLGMSINCARCHNHPLEKWTQDQYWGMANLFSRVGMKNGERGDVVVHAQPLGDVLHPRRNVAMPPTPLDGKPFDLQSIQDRRAYFTDWLTAPNNPYFAKAAVNRVWKNFMGRGLVEAEDDLRETNPPTNKELFDALAANFIQNRYDMKHLIRTIARSAAYQRSSRSNPQNSADDRFYSHYLIRRLSAEVMLDLFSQVSAVPTKFDQIYTGVEGGVAATTNYPMGTRALQLPDSRVASRFLDSFGRAERVATCSCERQQDSTVSQALMINNGQILNDKLRDKSSRVEAWLNSKCSEEEAIKRLFQLALCRDPNPKELAKLKGLFQGIPNDPAPRREAFEDLFWAVLSSREFVFNH